MIAMYYSAVFLVSLVLMAIYMLIWKKHDNVLITLVFVLVPVVNLGYHLLAWSRSLEAALIATHICYIGGCFLQPIIVLAIFSLCKIEVNRWVRVFFLLLNMAIYLASLTMGYGALFYASVGFKVVDGVGMLVKEYGVLHTVFYAMVIGYFALSLGVIAYSFLRNRQISRKLLLLLFLPQLVCMFSFFVMRRIIPDIELIPAAFAFAQAVYLLIARRMQHYDVTDTVIDAMVESGETGFITFDTRFRYLGSNDTARQILPGLSELTVDLGLKHSPDMEALLLPWLKQYCEDPEDPEANVHFYEKDDRVYLFTVGPLSGRRSLSGRKSLYGYRIVITDDTLDRAYIRLLDGFNQNLREQVEEKTAHIVKMSDNLILSMAVMVESRDNSTGGHIRRTSDVVRMLIDALHAGERPPEGYELTDGFCRMLIKAAPMHDLGKIAVDDAILRKPGRFTPEEFEKMKAHAAEGARIVHEILKDTDDEAFHLLAENVAHYHHERWDGSGYPERLKGTEIPPEARIMAVADVYDALVSKRVYKEKMSFEKANAIILEGMGSQFDPALEAAYVSAREALEAYYTGLEGAEDEERVKTAGCY